MVRILLSGAVNNAWDELYTRIEKLNALSEKKNNAKFDILICIGKVGLLPEAYTTGKAQIPIKTYCIPAYEGTSTLSTVASHSQNEERELLEATPNWFLLSEPFGIIEIEGVKIAYVAGVSMEAAKQDEISFSAETVKEFLTKVKNEKLDFFFSAELPNGYSNFSNTQIPPQLSDYRGSTLLRGIMQEIQPRYHITAAIYRPEAVDQCAFYERVPYLTICKDTNARQITRLINLCSVNDTVKDKTKKYLHALHITDTSSQDVQATQSPYMKMARTAEHDMEHARKVQKVSNRYTAGPSQFFFDTNVPRGRGPPIKERTECWFCLATPELERHLIVSIGQEAYLALPKGALSHDHILIIPIVHEKSTIQLSPSCKEEIERFKSQLRRMFASEGKEMIVFDRNVHSIGAAHCHMQVIGIPGDRSIHCSEVFETEGARYNITFEKLAAEQNLTEAVENRPFFYAEMPAMDQEADDSVRPRCRLLHIVIGKHYMQFGRHVVATLLGCPRRTNWKYCVVDKEEETILTQQFKNRWKPFDFTIEGR